MTILEQVLEANQQFVEEWKDRQLKDAVKPVSKIPSRELAIFTCMDTRLVDFLEGAMGVTRGEAKMIKTAGNTIASPFGVVIRSLVIGIYELGVNEVMVIGHHDCGMAATTAKGLKEKMIARGVEPDALKVVDEDLVRWTDSFHNPIENVGDVVKQIRENPFIPNDVPVHGLIFNPNSGELELIVNGYDHLQKA
jgi:carbonic anhydrase